MLGPVMNNLLNKKLILASSSPRRQELLKSIGLKFEIKPSNFDERSVNSDCFNTKEEYVMEVAEKKVDYVYKELQEAGKLPDIIIGADTIVELDGKLFEKPRDDVEATKFLQILQGKPHSVHTAVVLRSPKMTKKFVETTKVHMAPLSDEIIRSYVETKDPLDKAGAYGIQSMGGSLIEKIEGDYYNVIGLPLHKFCINLLDILNKNGTGDSES